MSIKHGRCLEHSVSPITTKYFKRMQGKVSEKIFIRFCSDLLTGDDYLFNLLVTIVS